jgi:bifunctional enzyme CysN/CysC
MSAALTTKQDVLAYLERHEHKDMLRFVSIGSVDDGKSTLIGRLLHDSGGLYDDQLRAVKRASMKSKGAPDAEMDFSLFTDGLKAEREQGITIDVAYRYFATAARKFIIADTPGHVQYTRNMATGASTADVAVVLIDARLGVLQQSRRHAYIAQLLGIAHLLVGVNKMDLVGFDAAVFERIREDFTAFTGKLPFKSVTYVPISALRGDNVVTRSERTPFYQGPTMLEFLEKVPVDGGRNLEDFRYPVQIVLRPNLDYRGYAAQVASGVVRTGDVVMALPSRRQTTVTAIDQAGTSLEEAFAPMSVTLRLADEMDVSRGDMLVHPTNLPRVERRFDAMLVWMHERPLDREKSYLLKHTTQTVRAEVESIACQVDLETLEEMPAERVGLNDIARVTLRTHKPLFVDAYRKNRATGAFILIDSLTNDTVGAGMVLEATARPKETAETAEASGERSQVSQRERRERLGHAGAVIVVPVEGAAAAIYALERELFDRGIAAVAIESTGGAELAAACARAGLVAVVAGGPEQRARLESTLGAGHVVDLHGAVTATRAAETALAVLAERGLLSAS